MTKEEAINRLKNMAWIYGSVEREQNIEAIDMAISALSEKTETLTHEEAWAEIEASDLISRAKVMNVVQNADDGNIPYEIIKDIIQGLPSVSAERAGEWIYRGTFKFSNHYPKHRHECSECHQIVHLPLTEEAYHYCPNCGARMENTK